GSNGTVVMEGQLCGWGHEGKRKAPSPHHLAPTRPSRESRPPLAWPATSARDERGAAINPDLRSGDVVGRIRDQEQDKLGDLLGAGWLSLAERDRALWVVNREPDALHVPLLSVIWNLC